MQARTAGASGKHGIISLLEMCWPIEKRKQRLAAAAALSDNINTAE
jgi:hypothetical protein